MTSPAFDSAIIQPVVADFLAVEVLLPFKELRLMNGASMVRFPADATYPAGRLFVGEDPDYGTLGALEAVTEGLGTQSPTMRLTILPPTRSAAAQLNLPSNQDSEIRLFYGVMNLETGAVIGVEQLFWGALNQPRYVGGKKAMAVEFDVASALEALFAVEEGQRLNHAFQTSAFPTDMGLEYVVDVERKLPWGSVADRPPLVSAAGGGYAPQYDGSGMAAQQASFQHGRAGTKMV